MHTSTARVVTGSTVLVGWQGRLSIQGSLLRIVSLASNRQLTVELSQVTEASFKSSSGVWSFLHRKGHLIKIQSAGTVLSADRTPSGRRTNDLILEQLTSRRVHITGI